VLAGGIEEVDEDDESDVDEPKPNMIRAVLVYRLDG